MNPWPIDFLRFYIKLKSQPDDFYFRPHFNHLQTPGKPHLPRHAKNEHVTRLCAPPRKSDSFLLASKCCNWWADFRSRYGRLAIFSWRGKSTGECGFESKQLKGRRSNLTKGRSSNQAVAGSRECRGVFARIRPSAPKTPPHHPCLTAEVSLLFPIIHL